MKRFPNTPIIVITGPTASGKSSLAIELAKKYDGIIINADSKQVYKELSIGTAQPIPDKIEASYWMINGIKHFLFGYVSIEDSYSLFKYQKDAYSVISENQEKPIFLVGGTGLYIDSVVLGYNLEESTDLKRSELESMTIEQLQTLVGTELQTLNNSDMNNPRRLIRLLEKKDTIPSEQKPEQHSLDYIYLVKSLDRELLKERIAERVDTMFENGLVDEAHGLKNYILDKKDTLDVIGYQEFENYYKDESTIEDVKELIKTHTNQYMKRQLTWFRNRTDAIIFKTDTEALPYIENFLSTFELPSEEV